MQMTWYNAIRFDWRRTGCAFGLETSELTRTLHSLVESCCPTTRLRQLTGRMTSRRIGSVFRWTSSKYAFWVNLFTLWHSYNGVMSAKRQYLEPCLLSTSQLTLFLLSYRYWSTSKNRTCRRPFAWSNSWDARECDSPTKRFYKSTPETVNLVMFEQRRPRRTSIKWLRPFILRQSNRNTSDGWSFYPRHMLLSRQKSQ